jgi:hypothetical protein
MKLDAGNPNLMKKRAMRVNLHATLQTFAQSTGDKAVAKERTGFVPSVKQPNAAPPPQMSIWERDQYEPPKGEYVRPGADDHLKFKSRGM